MMAILDIVWAFFKTIPLKVWLLLLLAVVLAVAHFVRVGNAHDEGYAEGVAEMQKKLDDANKESERKYRVIVEENNKIAKILIKRKDDNNEKRDAVLADIESGKLRHRFECPKTSSPATATTGSDEGAGSEFLDKDANFLIREASRADEVAIQLQSCQAVIKSYMEISNANSIAN